MKKIILRIIFILFVIVMGIIVYNFIVLQNIYNNTRMEELHIDNSCQTEIIKKFVNEDISVNYKYLIEEKDTIITFDFGKKSGLLWMLPELSGINTRNIKITKNEKISKLKNGTYRNFISKSNPLVNIRYLRSKVANIDRLSIEVMPQSEIVDNIIKDDINQILELKNQSILEIEDQSGKLIYRAELGQRLNLFIFDYCNSLCFLFLQ